MKSEIIGFDFDYANKFLFNKKLIQNINLRKNTNNSINEKLESAKKWLKNRKENK